MTVTDMRFQYIIFGFALIVGLLTACTTSKPLAKLMEMEKRDKDGNIVGQPEEGLWFKRGESKPYSGIVAGHYKGGQIESKRVYSNGIQVGTETHWYDNGKKRLELIYEKDTVISLKQWDPDGNEQGE